MRSPDKIFRDLFIASVGFLFVGVLFTMMYWPAAKLFTVIGSISSLVFYVWFNRAKKGADRSLYARHVAFGAFIVGQALRVFAVSFQEK